MKRIKYLAAFLYIVLLLFAMANLFPREDVKIMSFLRVENWKISTQLPETKPTPEAPQPLSFNGFWQQLKSHFAQ
jgi:hypothetical protein